MALNKHRTYCSTLLLIIITCQSIDSASATTKKLWGLKHKGTIKTIETKDGEVIDCVDIYKQPAFDNPLIKDLQMSPSSYPDGMEMELTSDVKLLQDWQKYGECPDGTIPIRRRTMSPSSPMIQRQSNDSMKVTELNSHEYAMVSTKTYSYYGARAKLNVWSPEVEYGEFSSTKIWLISEKSPELYEDYNSIEAGWTVNPRRYNDSTPRFYIYWTRDGHRKTGCFDLDCPGFVQTSKGYTIGGRLSPVSSYDGDQYVLPISIYKDVKVGNWWLVFDGTHVGYWPSSLFNTLSDHANIVKWGGEIVNDRRGGHHTTTKMGSGHFPKEGYGKAAYMWGLKVIDSDHAQKIPGFIIGSLTSLGCYDISFDEKAGVGYTVYYGGPGFCSSCFG